MKSNVKSKIFWHLLAILAFLLCSFSLGYGVIPETINYQGYLVGNGPKPVNGSVSITFSIYAGENDSYDSYLWRETQTVTVNNGMFSVILGETNPLGVLSFDIPYYLGVKVEADAEMTPRQPLNSVPYAFTADSAFSLSCNNCVSSTALAPTLNLNGGDASTPTLTVQGVSTGIFGSGNAVGIYGYGNSWGVYGEATSDLGWGVFGKSTGPQGRGVVGSSEGEGNGWGVYGYATGSDGRGVYGWAKNYGDVTNYGGYFVSNGGTGYGIYAEASGHSGKGVGAVASGDAGYAMSAGASGNNGTAVHATAWGSWGTAVYGSALGNGIGGDFSVEGPEGKAVKGVASNSSETASNYGGYFEAYGETGHGVFGSASGGNGKGVSGQATGDAGRAISATATGNNGTAIHATALGTWGTAVYGNGIMYDFYAGGPGTNYAPFTGSHEVKLSNDFPNSVKPGMVISVTGETKVRKTEVAISISSTLPTIMLSSKAKDKAVFGVFAGERNLYEEHWYHQREGERFGVINALGEGRAWVSNINGNIQPGDYITTSSIQGYGQKQDDDLLHSYTLGKAIETVDWDSVTETVEFNGKTYKVYLIAVVYTSG